MYNVYNMYKVFTMYKVYIMSFRLGSVGYLICVINDIIFILYWYSHLNPKKTKNQSASIEKLLFFAQGRVPPTFDLYPPRGHQTATARRRHSQQIPAPASRRPIRPAPKQDQTHPHGHAHHHVHLPRHVPLWQRPFMSRLSTGRSGRLRQNPEPFAAQLFQPDCQLHLYGHSRFLWRQV